MEALGEILQRIMSNRDCKPRSTSAPNSESNGGESEVCPMCDGAKVVSFPAPEVGREYRPCPRCVGYVDERQAKCAKFGESFPNQNAPRTFSNFEQDTPAHKKLYGEVREWIDDPERSHVITLAGPNGTGKSHTLEAIGRELMGLGWPVQYQRATRLMSQFRAEVGAEKPNLDRILQYLASPELLIVDDVTEYGTKFAAEMLEDIVEPRYQGQGYLAIGTNIPVEVMAEKWSYRLADRLFDIESGDTQLIYTMGKSYRTTKLWPILGRRGR